MIDFAPNDDSLQRPDRLWINGIEMNAYCSVAEVQAFMLPPLKLLADLNVEQWGDCAPDDDATD